MNSSSDDEICKEILKPEIVPSRYGKPLLKFALAIEAACLFLALVFQNRNIAIIPLWFLAIFVGLPLLFPLVWHFTWSITIFDKKLSVKDYLFPFTLMTGMRQEILFDEIDYIYYLEKEYNLLKNYRHKLRKYNIPANEMDYRKENLITKYGVPNELIERFEQSSQKVLNDYTATGVLMVLDAIFDKYEIPKNQKKGIIKDLKKTDDFTLEHVRTLLSTYVINSEDLDDLKDAFSDCDASVSTPFLLTKLNAAKVEGRENARGGAAFAASINSVLVLSHEGGTRKVYLKHFHSLSRADWQKLIHRINEKNTGVKYLMSSQSYRNLSDPNFKPGCA